MTSTRKANEQGLENWHLFADSVVFKQYVYCSFFRMGRGGLQIWSFFVASNDKKSKMLPMDMILKLGMGQEAKTKVSKAIWQKFW